jgi:hypothetical protein
MTYYLTGLNGVYSMFGMFVSTITRLDMLAGCMGTMVYVMDATEDNESNTV